jgi:hypothetical protein
VEFPAPTPFALMLNRLDGAYHLKVLELPTDAYLVQLDNAYNLRWGGSPWLVMTQDLANPGLFVPEVQHSYIDRSYAARHLATVTGKAPPLAAYRWLRYAVCELAELNYKRTTVADLGMRLDADVVREIHPQYPEQPSPAERLIRKARQGLTLRIK